MQIAEAGILSFVQVLANYPQDVTVKQIDGDPIVFEITVSAKDIDEIFSKHRAINAIAGFKSGLAYSQFVVKILER